MGSFLKGMLLAWIEIQKAEFPHLVKKWRREKIPCGKEWDETALGGKAPEERSLEVFREAITTLPPKEWPDWVRELTELASAKSGAR